MAVMPTTFLNCANINTLFKSNNKYQKNKTENHWKPFSEYHREIMIGFI